MQHIHKLLIANRGEIACRIARTARRLGLAVAGLHSSADAAAKHVREMDESLCIGGPVAADSYLNIDAVLRAARQCGADAVHPGYGFLSENAAFVRCVEAAGLIFIGPRADTIERLGGKAQAKREAAALGLPVIGGSAGALSEVAAVVALVRSMALPVLLKAVAGGGGRGMAMIETLDGLQARVETAMREAQAAFGSGELIVEHYLPRVRHIEVQIAGDGQGRAIHLFERECTLQRRHQKLVEEAPAARLSPALREAMCRDACRLAAAVGYRGLGTVEFVVAGDDHRFLEVNPRLQVEHPVTEAVTGLDLVELQLRIADEGRLPIAQSDVHCNGHAFEARLCAEDVAAGFLPSTGRISWAEFPEATLRIEAGVAAGDEVSAFYDSMIAKLVSHGASREAARARLITGLSETTVLGVAHNGAFLRQVLQWPETVDSSFHTRLIDERAGARQVADGVPVPHLAAVAIAWLQQQRQAADALGCWGEWSGFTGWRLSDGGLAVLPPPGLLLRAEGREWPVRFGRLQADGTVGLSIGDATFRSVALTPRADAPGRRRLHLDTQVLALTLVRDDTARAASWWVHGPLGAHRIDAVPWLGGAARAARADGQLGAPMMGKVVAVHGAVGDCVAAGRPVLVLESMKMELHVNAPFDGTLSRLHCAVGDMVERGAVLAEVQPLLQHASAPATAQGDPP